jgi:hypothetical protein
MKYIKTFESWKIDYIINESELEKEIVDSFDKILSGFKTNKPIETLKSELKTKLDSIQGEYKNKLREYISDKFDDSWFNELVNTLIKPASSLISSSEKNAIQSQRETIANENGKVSNPHIYAFAVSLARGSSNDQSTIDPAKMKLNKDKLVELLFQSSFDVATKLFESATSGLDNLSLLNFSFDDIDSKIKENEKKLEELKQTISGLEKNDNKDDRFKLIEYYTYINLIRTQQIALLAASQEYEFLTGSLKKSWFNYATPYMEAALEIGCLVSGATAIFTLINSIGNTAIWNGLEKIFADAFPTIIPNFQQSMNNIMNNTINPITSSVYFISAAAIAFIYARGSELANEKDFEDREKYLIIALEQFIPTLSAVSSTLAYTEAYKMKLKDWYETGLKNWWERESWQEIINKPESEKREWVEIQEEYMAEELTKDTLFYLSGSNSPIVDVVNMMEVSNSTKLTLTYNKILESDVRGKTAFYSGVKSLFGVSFDFIKNLDDIFDTMESKVSNLLEEDIRSYYESIFNKENPVMACLGGLVFLAQNKAIMINPGKFYPPIEKWSKTEIQSIQKVNIGVDIISPDINIPVAENPKEK